jgi:magnesium-transporting ATPase (P-type)
MAGTHCLKVISYAFKEIELKVLNELMHQFPLESEEFREVLESDLVYLATFGLLDPLRDNIVDAVQLIRYGFTISDPSEAENQVNVRMVSGDHLETAR